MMMLSRSLAVFVVVVDDDAGAAAPPAVVGAADAMVLVLSVLKIVIGLFDGH